MKLLTIFTAAVLATAACSTDASKNADSATAATDSAAISALPADTSVATAPLSGMMDPNAASAADLATIPGVTAAIATTIVEGRPYADNVALDKKLAGLSELERDSVYARLWTPIDLNSATDAEILLIPGVGSRMLHEFKEYRPYTSMDQFRREIGKYVDDAELARLERFVAIR